MLKRAVFFGMTGLFLISKACFAEISSENMLKEIKALKTKIERQEKRISELENKLYKEEKGNIPPEMTEAAIEDFHKHLDAHILHREEGYMLLGGLRMGLGASFVVQGTDNANGDNLSEKGEDSTDGSYSLDLEFEKEFEDYGKAFLHVETGDGSGVEDELQVFSNVNRDADDSDDSMKVTELWYEYYFKAMPVSLKAGKIDATILVDTNEYANDETTQFLGRIFRNSPCIEFPDNAGGFSLNIEPMDFVDVDMILMDANSDWEDVLDGIFFASQLNFKPNFLERKGNYRIIGWLNDDNHTEWDDPIDTKKEGYGIGISFDQELGDYLGVFLRYGWQGSDVYLNGSNFSLKQAWSSGVQITGSLWSRDNDIFGLAIGQVVPSDKYKNSASNLDAKDEGHFEAYYNYKVNEQLTLTPDLQFIWNPYGDDAVNGSGTITVVGIKGQVDF